MARIDELRAEHHELVNSMEFAYAMGHSRTLGAPDPRLERVVERAAELRGRVTAAAPPVAYALIRPCGSSTYFCAEPLSKSS
jgi:hypothetical protein